MFYVQAERRQAERRGLAKVTLPCRLCQRAKNLAAIQPRRDHVDAIKLAAGCADCGLKIPHPEVYDFDHLPGATKVKRISVLITSGTIEALDAEIAKCEVVCANCHRIRTTARGSNAFGVDRLTTTEETTP